MIVVKDNLSQVPGVWPGKGDDCGRKESRASPWHFRATPAS